MRPVNVDEISFEPKSTSYGDILTATYRNIEVKFACGKTGRTEEAKARAIVRIQEIVDAQELQQMKETTQPEIVDDLPF